MRPILPIIATPLWAILTTLVFAQVDIVVTDTKTIITTTDVRLVESMIVGKDGAVIGDPVTIEQNEKSSTKEGPQATLVTITTEAANVQFEVTDIKRLPVQFKEIDHHRYLLTSTDRQWIDILAVDFQKNIFFRKTIVVEPKPSPGPQPDPEPEPTPTPTPSPIEGPGFRVLFVSESGDSMPPDVGAIFYDKEIQDWLNTNCVKVDGQPDFRRVDPDSKFTDSNHRFAKALARPRDSLPWIIASNGTTNVGYEGPFPATKQALWDILKRIGNSTKSNYSFEGSPQITMFTTHGCESCQRFIMNEVPKLNANGIKIHLENGGCDVYPTFKLKRGNKIKTVVGFVTSEIILENFKALK